MNARLLIIDPQNDFCDIPGAALPVTGAHADMQRLAAFMGKARDKLTHITVTLDSHASIGIERTTFWVQANGEAVVPFTQIVESDVHEGRFQPRDATLKAATLAYLRRLEQGGRYRLMVWPVHCVLGTWGHNIHDDVAKQLAHWELQQQRPAARILKGLNPMTEQYSAIQAEVPLDDDESTHTNRALIELARPGNELLLVAGEAASHCVAATVQHLLQALTPAERQRVVLLTDCMSAVTGFQPQADAFFKDAAAQGARVLTAEAALGELARH
jgi:nicotinamidase-related amidase